MLIKDLRTRLGMSREEFAVAIMASHSSVTKWEIADKTIDDPTINRVFRVGMQRMWRGEA